MGLLLEGSRNAGDISDEGEGAIGGTTLDHSIEELNRIEDVGAVAVWSIGPSTG